METCVQGTTGRRFEVRRMMREYRKGSRVEVLRSRERARECWRTGEVVGGNGRFYIVRFDGFACCGGSPLVQAVRPDSIRPCPPLLKVPKLRRGNVVEVLVDFGWQTATVSNVLRNRFVWVMLGDCEKIRVRKGDVRVKQSLLNDEWVAIKQQSHTSANGKKTSTINLMCKSEIMQTKAQNDLKGPDDRATAKETNKRTHQTRLKRKSLCDNNPEPCIEATRKSRAIEKDGLAVRAPAVAKSLMAANPGTRYLSTETRNQALTCSFWSKLSFSKKNAAKENPFDTDATVSSVGSCSVTSHGIHVLHYHKLGPECSQEYEGYVSDAESFCGRISEERNNIQPVEKAILAEVQRCNAIRSFEHPCDLFLKLILVFAAFAITLRSSIHWAG